MSTLSEIYRSIRSDQSNDQSSEGGMDMDDGRKEERQRVEEAHMAVSLDSGHCNVQKGQIDLCRGCEIGF